MSFVYPVFSDSISSISDTIPKPTTIQFPISKPLRMDIDIGANNYLLQKQMAEYLLYRILDKWLYEDEMQSLRKYIVVRNGKVTPLTSKKDISDNNFLNDTIEEIEKKADFIEDTILGLEQMRQLLYKLIKELGLKWYNLPSQEQLVIHYAKKFIKNKLKQFIK
jgi:hypothetical protein